MNARVGLFTTLAWLVTLALLAAAGSGAVYHYRSAYRRAEIRLRRAERERERLYQQRPAPAEASARGLEADATELQRTVAVLEAPFAESDVALGQNTSAPSAELFFALGAWVEAMRAGAGERCVSVAPDAAGFGFSAYGKEGPDPLRAACVRRQMEILAKLLGALVTACPETILVVQREAPLSNGERQARHVPPKTGERLVTAASRMSARDGADYFTLDPRWSVFAAGVVDTLAFRVVFVGTTQVLREFVRGVSAGGSALVIRAIEVEPAPRGPDVLPRKKDDPLPSIVLGENVPIPNHAAPPSRASKFSVIVEHVGIVPIPSGSQLKSGS